jgi:hypothetical protein
MDEHRAVPRPPRRGLALARRPRTRSGAADAGRRRSRVVTVSGLLSSELTFNDPPTSSHSMLSALRPVVSNVRMPVLPISESLAAFVVPAGNAVSPSTWQDRCGVDSTPLQRSREANGQRQGNENQVGRLHCDRYVSTVEVSHTSVLAVRSTRASTGIVNGCGDSIWSYRVSVLTSRSSSGAQPGSRLGTMMHWLRVCLRRHPSATTRFRRR